MLPFILGLLLLLANPEIKGKRAEQRITLKFLVKSGLSPIECWRKLKEVWKDATMCKTQVRSWHKRFKSGEEVVNDLPKSGRPRTKRTPENIAMVRDLLTDNPRQSLRDLCDQTDRRIPEHGFVKKTLIFCVHRMTLKTSFAVSSQEMKLGSQLFKLSPNRSQVSGFP